MKKRSSIQIMKDVLFALVLREFLTRFGSRRMGAFWIFFEPVAHIAVMMFVFTVVGARQLPGIDFPVFLMTGMIPYFLMRNIAVQLMESVNANQALFAYPNIKVFDTYIARILVEVIISSSVYCILIFVLGFWFHYDVTISHPLKFTLSLLTGFLFSFGLGVLLSILAQAMPNIRSFVQLVFMPIYFISGIIFPLWVVPDKYLPWILWNPYAHIVSNIRSSVFFYYPDINGVSYSYPAYCAIVFLFCGLGLYRVRKERLLVR